MPLTNEPNEKIAWEYLSPEAIITLLHWRPDLRDEYEAEKKPFDKRDGKIYN